VDTAHLVGLLLAALAATNAAWLLAYHSKSSECEALRSTLHEVNTTVSKLAERAKSLDEENTRLLLQLQEARQSYERLLDLLRQANTSTKAALVSVLASLNETITQLYRYTFSHAYYTPATRSLYRPGQVADKVFEILGAPIYRPNMWSRDMEALYNWTASHIQYSPDHHFAAIKDLRLVEIGGKRYISGFDIDITSNYIQEPLETLLRGAGDCEDQAVLLSSLYSIYLHDVGSAWVLCLLAQDFSHCFSVAYVKPNNTYVVADPATRFYTEAKSLRQGVSSWMSFIGVKWSDINRAIVFNNTLYREGSLDEVLDALTRSR